MGNILSFFLIHAVLIALYPLDSIAKNMHLYIQMLCSVILISVCIINYKSFFKQYKRLNTSLLLFAVACFLSTYFVLQSPPFPLASPYTSILYALQVVCSILVVEYINVKGMGSCFLKKIFTICLLYAIVADIEIFMSSRTDMGGNNVCFLGDKFTTCYLHLFLCCIYYKIYLSFRGLFSLQFFLIFSGIALLTTFVSWYTMCSTGLMGVTFFILSVIFRERLFNVYRSAKVLILSILTLDILMLLLFSLVLNNSFSQYLIIDVLNEDLTAQMKTSVGA